MSGFFFILLYFLLFFGHPGEGVVLEFLCQTGNACGGLVLPDIRAVWESQQHVLKYAFVFC